MSANPAGPRVFVVQEGAHDYTPAQAYGAIQFLALDEITPTPLEVSPRNRAIVEGMRAVLASYIPGVDYVLLTGSPIAMVWAAFLMAEGNGSAKHQFLKWDAQARQYLPYVIEQRK